jgi:hypothetical protein
VLPEPFGNQKYSPGRVGTTTVVTISFLRLFRSFAPKSMTKLPPLCSPRFAHPALLASLLTLSSSLLPERSPSLTVDPPSTPICPSTLDDRTHFRSRGFPFTRLLPNNHLGSKFGLFERRSLRDYAAFPPFCWRLRWGVPVLPAINACSSLFSVVLDFLSVIF